MHIVYDIKPVKYLQELCICIYMRNHVFGKDTIVLPKKRCVSQHTYCISQRSCMFMNIHDAVFQYVLYLLASIGFFVYTLGS